jgi:predicted amidohydrolase YtcJ
MAERTACDLLLINAHVLTMDDRFTVHPSGAVAIDGGAIRAVGDIADQDARRSTAGAAW